MFFYLCLNQNKEPKTFHNFFSKKAIFTKKVQQKRVNSLDLEVTWDFWNQIWIKKLFLLIIHEKVEFFWCLEFSGEPLPFLSCLPKAFFTSEIWKVYSICAAENFFFHFQKKQLFNCFSLSNGWLTWVWLESLDLDPSKNLPFFSIKVIHFGFGHLFGGV